MKRDDFLELESVELSVPYTNKKRRVRVLLPKNYYTEEERYPVLYMHDGQNVFYSREAYSGYSWKTIPAIKRNPDIKKMIIVGIDNDNENRLFEYSPWKFENVPITAADFNPNDKFPTGYEYGEFLFGVVKPFIDSHYRTKSEREFTAMAGSSLGASISQYLGAKYSHLVGALGIFSSANWLFQSSFDYFMRDIQFEAQRVFIQVGTNEYNEEDASLIGGNVNQHYVDSSLNYFRQLLEKGVPLEDVQIIVATGERHSERAWAKYFPEFLRFLSRNW